MKNKLFVFALLILILLTSAGCAPGSIAQVNTPAPNAKGGTPTPNGEITVPSVSIQVNAPGPNPLANKADGGNRVAGLLMGIWHGVISPITLLVSFFNPGVQMYEVHNDGSQYNLGFLLGVIIVFFILGAAAGSRRRS